MKKRVLALVVSMVLLLSALVMDAGAAEATASDIVIPEEVAEIMAGFFIRDMRELPDIS